MGCTQSTAAHAVAAPPPAASREISKEKTPVAKETLATKAAAVRVEEATKKAASDTPDKSPHKPDSQQVEKQEPTTDTQDVKEEDTALSENTTALEKSTIATDSQQETDSNVKDEETAVGQTESVKDAVVPAEEEDTALSESTTAPEKTTAAKDSQQQSDSNIKDEETPVGETESVKDSVVPAAKVLAEEPSRISEQVDQTTTPSSRNETLVNEGVDTNPRDISSEETTQEIPASSDDMPTTPQPEAPASDTGTGQPGLVDEDPSKDEKKGKEEVDLLSTDHGRELGPLDLSCSHPNALETEVQLTDPGTPQNEALQSLAEKTANDTGGETTEIKELENVASKSEPEPTCIEVTGIAEEKSSEETTIQYVPSEDRPTEEDLTHSHVSVELTSTDQASEETEAKAGPTDEPEYPKPDFVASEEPPQGALISTDDKSIAKQTEQSLSDPKSSESDSVDQVSQKDHQDKAGQQKLELSKPDGQSVMGDSACGQLCVPEEKEKPAGNKTADREILDQDASDLLCQDGTDVEETPKHDIISESMQQLADPADHVKTEETSYEGGCDAEKLSPEEQEPSPSERMSEQVQSAVQTSSEATPDLALAQKRAPSFESADTSLGVSERLPADRKTVSQNPEFNLQHPPMDTSSAANLRLISEEEEQLTASSTESAKESAMLTSADQTQTETLVVSDELSEEGGPRGPVEEQKPEKVAAAIEKESTGPQSLASNEQKNDLTPAESEATSLLDQADVGKEDSTDPSEPSFLPKESTDQKVMPSKADNVETKWTTTKKDTSVTEEAETASVHKEPETEDLADKSAADSDFSQEVAEMHKDSSATEIEDKLQDTSGGQECKTRSDLIKECHSSDVLLPVEVCDKGGEDGQAEEVHSSGVTHNPNQSLASPVSKARSTSSTEGTEGVTLKSSPEICSDKILESGETLVNAEVAEDFNPNKLISDLLGMDGHQQEKKEESEEDEEEEEQEEDSDDADRDDGDSKDQDESRSSNCSVSKEVSDKKAQESEDARILLRDFTRDGKLQNVTSITRVLIPEEKLNKNPTKRWGWSGFGRANNEKAPAPEQSKDTDKNPLSSTESSSEKMAVKPATNTKSSGHGESKTPKPSASEVPKVSEADLPPKKKELSDIEKARLYATTVLLESERATSDNATAKAGFGIKSWLKR